MANPSLFQYSEAYYLAHNPDVAAAVRAGVFSSGLAHWQMYGSSEGREASPFFDWQVYRDMNPDLGEAGLTTQAQVIVHFNNYGFQEGRPFLSASVFDAEYYAAFNPDLAAAGITSTSELMLHFVQAGYREGRIAHPAINGAAYIDKYPDLVAAFSTRGSFDGFTNKDAAGIYHYYNWGLAEGRALGDVRHDTHEGIASAFDIDNSHTYSSRDSVTLKFIEGVDASSLTLSDLVISNGHTLGSGATIAAVNSNNGIASEFKIILGAGTTVVQGDDISVARGSVLYVGGRASVVKEVFELPKVETVAPTASRTGSIISADNNANGVYSTSDTITLKFSEPISTSLKLSDLTVRNNHSFGVGATLSPVGATSGFATEFVVTLGRSPTVTKNDAIVVKAAAIVDLAGNGAAMPVTFIVPELAMPETEVGDAPPVATNFVATSTRVGATSNETGTLGLYNGSTLIGSVVNFTAPSDLTVTLPVSAQSTVTNATLKVADAAGNFASSTQSVILGTSSADMEIAGTAASDFIYGFAGHDDISGNEGDDIIYGDSGNDSIYGNEGADIIYGGDNSDLIQAGKGNDTVYGDAGDDLIYGGTEGFDELTGGAGADDFLLPIYSLGYDTIKDFVSGTDDIDVTPGGALSAGINAPLSAIGTETTVTAPGAANDLEITDNDVYYVSTNGTSGSLVSVSLTTISLADLTAGTLTNLAAYLDERFTNSNQTGSAGDVDAIIIVNWTEPGVNMSYVYEFVENANSTEIVAAELSLIGVVDRTASVLTTGDVI